MLKVPLVIFEAAKEAVEFVINPEGLVEL